MNAAWFKRQDWPQQHELLRRSKLLAAIRQIPGGHKLSDEDAEWKALNLWRDSNIGLDEQMNRNRPASHRASEGELRKLAALAEKLETHIHKLHHPAVSALYSEGCNIFDFANELESMKYSANNAFSGLNTQDEVLGAGKKLQASIVTEGAAIVFKGVSGRKPTFTTDPVTNEISGDWPSFLREVFSALWIEASVAAQVKSLSQKSTEK